MLIGLSKSTLFSAALCLAGPALADGLPTFDVTFPELNAPQIELGQLLFFDPILSGNKTVSCATCHHPRFNTSDGVSLGIGDGGIGLGPTRALEADNPPSERIPRNAPALFNLGASEFTSMFHDGRLERDSSRPSGIRTPLGSEMEAGFSTLLSAQTMFPVLSPNEMAGHFSENEVSQAVRQGVITGPGGAWDILSKRIEAIPVYRSKFDGLVGAQTPIHFTDISDAVAAFIDFEWRAVNSPFDHFLRDGTPLAPDAAAGMELFYGDAGCSSCHSGLFQTDHSFHAIAMPQIGPGKAAGFESHQRDVGRMGVTGALADQYAFRTPSLRNVVHTGPYGHAGAYTSLEATIRHHLDPVSALNNYDAAFATLPKGLDHGDFTVMNDATEIDAIAAANSLAPMVLNDQQVAELIAFLDALTDTASLRGALGVPSSVPSGLPFD